VNQGKGELLFGHVERRDEINKPWAHRFTEAEARLAAGLATGASLEVVADRLG
jgi:hypothetical protein